VKENDTGFMWFRTHSEVWRVRHVRVARVTDRGTLIAQDIGTGQKCETSGLYIYHHRWECIESTPMPTGKVKEEEA